MIHYRTIDSPIGPLTLAGHGSVLTNLRMLEQTYEPSRTHWTPDPGAFSGAVDQLNAYFAGELTEFDVELDLRGTDFQQRVWKALLTIPYGETRSYGEIADQIGAPGAARAVGLAQRPQSHRHHRPVPPRDRRQRKAHRVRRWNQPETSSARVGEKPGARRLDALRLSAPAREGIVIAKIEAIIRPLASG